MKNNLKMLSAFAVWMLMGEYEYVDSDAATSYWEHIDPLTGEESTYTTEEMAEKFLETYWPKISNY